MPRLEPELLELTGEPDGWCETPFWLNHPRESWLAAAGASLLWALVVMYLLFFIAFIIAMLLNGSHTHVPSLIGDYSLALGS